MSSFTRPTSAGLLALIALLAAGCGNSDPKPQSLPKVGVTVKDVTVAVELARTPEQRQTGMMHRTRLREDEGMLFAFAEADFLRFYMKNTHVPLSIAFIKADGVIDRIAGMRPEDLTTVESRVPCRYALEMPQGWFGRHGVVEGDTVAIPDEAQATE